MSMSPPSVPPMHFKFSYEADDFVGVASGGSRSRRKQGGMLGWLIMMALAMGFFCLLQSQRGVPRAARPVHPSAQTLWTMIIPLIPWLMIFAFVYLVVLRQVRRDVFKWRGLVGVSKILDINHEGVRLEDASATRQCPWHDVVTWRETDRLILMRGRLGHDIAVPKRIMTAQQQEELRNVLSRLHAQGQPRAAAGQAGAGSA